MTVPPLVSVKMITYNHAPYIAQAIEGVLQQKTNFHFELVIGEDCSTDGTREIVFEYKKKYPDIIRVITSEQNVGMKKNGYRTMKACRGKYIAFCEGDDYWHHTEKLQKQVDYLETHPAYGLVHTEFDMYYADSGWTIQSYHLFRKDEPENANFMTILDGKCPIRTCTVVAKLDLVKRVINSDPILFQENRFLMGDTPLWAELSRVTQIGYIDQSLATYNILPESMSRSRNTALHLRFVISSHEMQLYLLDKYRIYSSFRERCERYLWDSRLRLAFIEKDRDLGQNARQMLLPLTVRQKLLFLGSQHIAINYVLRIGRVLRKWARGNDIRFFI